MLVNMNRTDPVAVPPKAGYHHGDLARALCIAAAGLIESGRPLTLRAAADAAGVSAAAPYRHFADRATLLAAVLAEGFRELARVTEAARAAAPDPLGALQAVGVSYVHFATVHPRIYRLMFGPECDKAAHPELMAAGRAAFGVLQAAVADCEAAGLLAPADPVQVALSGWSIAHGLASLHADGFLAGRDAGDMAPAIMHMLINGVRAGDSGDPG